QPDSPTSERVSPASSVNDKPFTTSTASVFRLNSLLRGWYVTRRSRTSSTGAPPRRASADPGRLPQAGCCTSEVAGGGRLESTPASTVSRVPRFSNVGIAANSCLAYGCLGELKNCSVGTDSTICP